MNGSVETLGKSTSARPSGRNAVLDGIKRLGTAQYATDRRPGLAVLIGAASAVLFWGPVLALAL